MKISQLTSALLLISFTFLLVVSSCRPRTETVKVQFMHAANHSGYVDYYLQGSLRSSLIGVGGGSNSNTADLEAGEPLVIEIKNPATGATLVSKSFADWKAGTHYSFVMYGDSGNLKSTLLSDTMAWPAAGRFKVRYSHFSADAPTLDVFYNNDTVAFNKVYYGTDSTNAIGDFVDLPSGMYTVTVKDHNTGQTYIIQPNMGIQDNRILEIYSAGLIADSLTAFFRLGGIAH